MCVCVCVCVCTCRRLQMETVVRCTSTLWRPPSNGAGSIWTDNRNVERTLGFHIRIFFQLIWSNGSICMCAYDTDALRSKKSVRRGSVLSVFIAHVYTLELSSFWYILGVVLSAAPFGMSVSLDKSCFQLRLHCK